MPSAERENSCKWIGSDFLIFIWTVCTSIPANISSFVFSLGVLVLAVFQRHQTSFNRTSAFQTCQKTSYAGMRRMLTELRYYSTSLLGNRHWTHLMPRISILPSLTSVADRLSGASQWGPAQAGVTTTLKAVTIWSGLATQLGAAIHLSTLLLVSQSSSGKTLLSLVVNSIALSESVLAGCLQTKAVLSIFEGSKTGSRRRQFDALHALLRVSQLWSKGAPLVIK